MADVNDLVAAEVPAPIAGPSAASAVARSRGLANELAGVLIDARLTPQQRLQRRFELLAALMEKKT